MAVEKAVLEQLAADVAGDDEELRKLILERIGGNDKAATAFAGGFMRQADYSKKTETLAQEKKRVEQATADYERRLNEADAEKRQILNDLAHQKTTTAEAEALLENVKKQFLLSDDDIPGMTDLIKTRKSGKVTDSTPEFDPAKFKAELLAEFSSKLLPELSSLTAFPVIWDEISHEHEQITGKRMTKKEREELLAGARAANEGRGMSLVDYWEQKYEIGDKRIARRDEQNKEKWKAEWEADQARKRSEEALAGVRRDAGPMVTDEQSSPVFRRKFEASPDPLEAANKPDPAKVTPGLTGAERAANRYMQRRASGVPLGQPDKAVA